MGLMDRVRGASAAAPSPSTTERATFAQFDVLSLLEPKVQAAAPTPTPPAAARAPASTAAGALNAQREAPLGLATKPLLTAHLPDWRRTADGEKVKPYNTVPNILGLAICVGIRLRYNVMTRKTEIFVPGLAAARDDIDNAALACLGDCMERAGMSRRNVKELADAAAGERPYHPALEFIEAKPWDGTSRLVRFRDTLVLRDASLRPLRDKLIDAWMLQGIGALVQVDGVAAQGVLVIAGDQNVGKTRWVEHLGAGLPGAVRTGMHLNPRDKDSVFQATSTWITELGELDHTVRHADVSALKAFITRPEDTLRRPYALTDNTYRRRTIFVGTVNGTGFLADSTGDRRFWVVAVQRCELLLPDEMQQVWAEYKAMYDRGERWHLDAATYAALNEANADHRMIDPLEEMIRGRFDWANYAPPASPGGPAMQATDICKACGIPQPTQWDATRASRIVRQLNGDKAWRSTGKTVLAVPEERRR